MNIPILRKRSEGKPSGARSARSRLRVGIPRALNVWSTHRFWIGFLTALGVEPRLIDFTADTSEDQTRRFANGRGTVDCCYPVKCMSGHYGELLAREKKTIDVLLAPMIRSLPSILAGHVADSLACPRVMAAPEAIKAGFVNRRNALAERGIAYATPLVSLADRALVPRQLFEGLRECFPGLTREETRVAVAAGFEALDEFNRAARGESRRILGRCASEGRPCLLVLARPYHMDPGIGHEIEVELQAYGYPVLWAQYLPTDPDLLDWSFGAEIRAGTIDSAFDISDVWPSSYSANTNEILWGAKVAARTPWIACVVRLSSYECGMDQPTYSPVQQIVERSGTLFFSFQDLDSTKAAGSVKLRVETIGHYLGKRAAEIVARKLAVSPPGCPLVTSPGPIPAGR